VPFLLAGSVFVIYWCFALYALNFAFFAVQGSFNTQSIELQLSAICC